MGERIATDTVVSASSTVNLNVTVPLSAATNLITYARFRLGGPVPLPVPPLLPTMARLRIIGSAPTYHGSAAGKLRGGGPALPHPGHLGDGERGEHTGFNLYRALAVDGERTLLANVPSQSPGGTAGAAYSYQDYEVQPGQTYWYYLEDLDLSGRATQHGPVNVDFPGPVAVTLSELKADAGRVRCCGWWRWPAWR